MGAPAVEEAEKEAVPAVEESEEEMVGGRDGHEALIVHTAAPAGAAGAAGAASCERVPVQPGMGKVRAHSPCTPGGAHSTPPGHCTQPHARTWRATHRVAHTHTDSHSRTRTHTHTYQCF
jgi:hypothetical protein